VANRDVGKNNYSGADIRIILNPDGHMSTMLRFPRGQSMEVGDDSASQADLNAIAN